MNAKRLDPGLYLVATPIGNARDITLRAIDILTHADVIAAEDTRTARKLMDIHGIALSGRRITAYHDHSAPKAAAALAGHVTEGKSVAYVSEAGMPLIADPGYGLVQSCIAQDVAIFSAPGASAALCALSISGLPSDRFMFAGFPPPKAAARTRFLEEIAPIKATLVLYESPKRLGATLEALVDTFGGTRDIAICRELTKKFEQVWRGSLGEAVTALENGITLKGEFVIVLAPPNARITSDADIDAFLSDALATARVKDAANQAAAMFDIPKRDAYSRALALSKQDD
jgi:16S rRNA (cytidine1402-2'-O)-methyltransferase